jgi:sulfatase maturation enzyme AslB (radical SAM superfamily)
MSMLHVFSHGGSSYIYDGESMLVARCSHEVALEVIKRDSSGDKIVNFNERDLIYAEKDLGRSVESPADEDAHYSLDSDGSDEGKMPRGSIVAIQLLIMGSCNLACSYCYASRGEFSNPSPGRRFMSTDTVYKAMKFAMRNAAPAITVSLLGGEPLLHPNFVEIVEAVYEGVPSNVSISVSVSTNGTVFRSDISECLKKFSVKVSVSVDGSQEAHDSQRRYASNPLNS